MYLTFPKLRLRISLLALPAALCMLWVEGKEPFLILALSALVHELGHLTALKLCGKNPRRIDVLPMGALIVVPEGIPYRGELAIALSGPLASLCASLLFFAFFASTGKTSALFAALVNLTLGLFNLLPIKKLDGGKALAFFLLARLPDEIVARACALADRVSKMVFLALSALSLSFNPENLGMLLLTAVLVSQIFK